MYHYKFMEHRKGERTLDLWGTPILLKSSNLKIISRFLKTGTLTYCAWKITFLDTKKHYKAREILWINIFEDVKTDFVMLFGVWKCDDLGTISYCA